MISFYLKKKKIAAYRLCWIWKFVNWWILELCWLITIKDNNIKYFIDISGHEGNYCWLIFILEKSLLVNYFAKISVARFNKHQRIMYFIGLGYYHETKNYSFRLIIILKKLRKCSELKILLNEKGYKIKSILRMNTLLINSNVEEK